MPPGQCKDGDPTFQVGGKTYACEADFNEKGGQCRTPDRTAEEQAEDAEVFQQWLEKKGKAKGNGKGNSKAKDLFDRRRLGGCGGDCVDWDGGQIITIPVSFHIFHNGNDGKQFTCKYSQGSGFTELPGGDCNYVKEQIRVLNKGFAGVQQDNVPALYRDDTRIQFCLVGANDVRPADEYDNSGYYNDSGNTYKGIFRTGEMETLNVWANQAQGYLGYATFPGNSFTTNDGVVLLSKSMPNGGSNNYQEGDTLPHEVGHWLQLYHTFQGGCDSSTGDYNDLAGFNRIVEGSAASGCPTGRNTCSGDGGADPVHNFMDYSYDTCMDEFNPGQSLQMQAAWENFRHKVGESELWNVAADGVSCKQEDVPTASPEPPTPPPTSNPTTAPTTSAPTPPIGPTVQASFDGTSPRCSGIGGACSSGALLNSRGTMGTSEPNNFNTIDGCTDGSTGTYHSDESNDAIEVSVVGGGLLQVGKYAVVKATVWAWSTFTSDTADFYVTEGDSDPTWVFIGSVKPSGGGAQILESKPFALTSTTQTVRVSYRYQGSANPCSTGNYDDADDLVFAVASDTPVPPTPPPTPSPTPAPTPAPTQAPTPPTPPPTSSPTTSPTRAPTNKPTTPAPTSVPTPNPTPPPVSPCTQLRKKKFCRNDAACRWSRRQGCISK